MIKSISNIKQNIDKLREIGIQRGNRTGFKCLDELYSVKNGTFTIIQGSPTHGKSELIFELMMSQASKFGKKGIILSPESGNAEEIAMELIHKYIGKSAYSQSQQPCTEREYHEALNWIEYNFAIADDEEKSYSFDDLCKEIKLFEKANNCKYSNIMAEPWNELDHKLILSSNSGRQDLAIEDELTQLRRYCKKEDRHVFLSFHPASQSVQKDSSTGITYYEIPKAREAAGGQATLRKAFSWINIWRPAHGLTNGTTGLPYEENELIVQIEKSKPKGVGKKGTCTLFFDWHKNRYYEQDRGIKMYAFEHENILVSDYVGTYFENNNDEPPF